MQWLSWSKAWLVYSKLVYPAIALWLLGYEEFLHNETDLFELKLLEAKI